MNLHALKIITEIFTGFAWLMVMMSYAADMMGHFERWFSIAIVLTLITGFLAILTNPERRHRKTQKVKMDKLYEEMNK